MGCLSGIFINLFLTVIFPKIDSYTYGFNKYLARHVLHFRLVLSCLDMCSVSGYLFTALHVLCVTSTTKSVGIGASIRQVLVVWRKKSVREVSPCTKIEPRVLEKSTDLACEGRFTSAEGKTCIGLCITNGELIYNQSLLIQYTMLLEYYRNLLESQDRINRYHALIGNFNKIVPNKNNVTSKGIIQVF